MSVEFCANCKFWLARNAPPEQEGRCRRNPPVISSGIADRDADATLFPVTYEDDWCGEYQPVSIKPKSRHEAIDRDELVRRIEVFVPPDAAITGWQVVARKDDTTEWYRG